MSGPSFKWIREKLHLSRWPTDLVSKGAAALAVGIAGRTIAQAGVFLIVARILGVESYGAYVAVLALAGILGNLSGFGGQLLMIRDVARKPEAFVDAWGKALGAIAVSVPVLFLFYLLLAYLLIPKEVSWAAIIFLGLAELVFAPLLRTGSAAYLALEDFAQAARLSTIPLVPRLLGAVTLLICVDNIHKSVLLQSWAAVYALTALISTVYVLRHVKNDLTTSLNINVSNILKHVHEGVAYSLGSLATRLYSDIDKTMLARMATLGATGAYSAAYRIVDFILIPISALLSSSLPAFFREGISGVSRVANLSRAIFPISFLYALLAGISIYVFSPLVMVLLGDEFAVAVSVIQWLSPLPLISLPRLFMQNIMFGIDRQKVVVYILISSAVLNILFNLYLIPIYGWKGAVISTYIAEIAMGSLLSVAVFYYKARERNPGFY